MHWYLEAFRKFADFHGRARRKEYWMFMLFNVLFIMVAAVVDVLTGTVGAIGTFGLVGGVYGLAIVIPGLAVTVRRLHDTGRSGWWLLISFVPFIGVFVLLFLVVLNSQPAANRFGENPKADVVPSLAG
jgi:uncharacterized membrane protein YhaH (DUF805 family)